MPSSSLIWRKVSQSVAPRCQSRASVVLPTPCRWMKLRVSILNKDLIRADVQDRSDDRPDRAGYVVAQDQAQEERRGGGVQPHPAIAYQHQLDQPGHQEGEPEVVHGEAERQRVAGRVERPPGKGAAHDEQEGDEEAAGDGPAELQPMPADRIREPVVQPIKRLLSYPVLETDGLRFRAGPEGQVQVSPVD